MAAALKLKRDVYYTGFLPLPTVQLLVPASA